MKSLNQNNPMYANLNRAACVFIVLLSVVQAFAQGPKLKDIESCNGINIPATEQINGCNAIIDSASSTPQMLAVAHNNRGNAYVKNGQYDRALQDFDQSLKI